MKTVYKVYGLQYGSIVLLIFALFLNDDLLIGLHDFNFPVKNGIFQCIFGHNVEKKIQKRFLLQ